MNELGLIYTQIPATEKATWKILWLKLASHSLEVYRRAQEACINIGIFTNLKACESLIHTQKEFQEPKLTPRDGLFYGNMAKRAKNDSRLVALDPLGHCLGFSIRDTHMPSWISWASVHNYVPVGLSPF